MMDDYSPEPKWYVAHTYSGYENKVKDNLEKIVENRGLSHLIYDIRIPMEVTVEMDGDEEKKTENKIFPSYVLVKMIMTDESWHVIRNIRGVTGFVGPGSRPVPLTDEEVANLGIETGEEIIADTKEAVLTFKVGDTVTITDGLLSGNTAVVSAISQDGKKVTVVALMFGRETSIELDVTSVTSV